MNEGRKLDIQNAVALLTEEGYELKAPPPPVGGERIAVKSVYCDSRSSIDMQHNIYCFLISKDFKLLSDNQRESVRKAIEDCLNEHSK